MRHTAVEAMLRPLLPLLALSAALVACSARADPEQSSDSVSRPNMVLVSVDCLRADHLGAYGYKRDTSPRIDQLAAQGVRFERCLATTSWTLPAHLSMLTGLPLSGHGVDDDRLWLRKDADGKPVEVPLRGVFVSEVLAQEGYATAGFYTWKYLEPQFGFGPGFDVYERLNHNFYSHPVIGPQFEALRVANDREGMAALAQAHPTLFDDTSPTAPEVVDRALAWLDGERDGDAPFFLFLHVFDCHDPYSPPAPYDKLFDPDYSGTIDGRRVTTPDSPVRKDMAAEDLHHLIARYDGSIRFVDDELGRFLDALDERGLTEDTLIAVTGDHGEEFFEHGRKTHRNQLYLESVSVPLILRWPASLPANTVIAGNSGLVDLMPTFCAAAGAPMSGGTMGIDLLPIARGQQGNGARTYLSELVVFDKGVTPQRLVSIIKGDEQRILAARGKDGWGGVRLDLGSDPLGRGWGSATEDHAVVLERLRGALTRLRVGLPSRQAGEPMSESDLADLAAMGYGGHGEDLEGGGDGERLILDGGVWPDGE